MRGIAALLVANRGEIARRIFRTARRLKIATIAVYSEADAGAPHVREADRAICVGPPPAARSYLDGDRIIAAAKQSGADAIHPGYGFLSENADFAEAVVAAGLIWVGPPPAAMRAMARKDAAKALMVEAGVPVTPGYLGQDQGETRLAEEAGRIGFPVLIKAVAGGGGKGMRRVDDAAHFSAALASARREASAAFGDDRVLLEACIEHPRHIEVQVFGDLHGRLVHMFERDCSVQRRHQKVIEEAPAPGLTEGVRLALTQIALRAAKAVRYAGAGTVEFIADAREGLRPDRIWFMEMNTRLQVEHPVTEAVTGLDLVEWQLRVAAGEPLPLSQEEIALSGHAMEARLYAEAPAAGFLPSVGPLRHMRLPSSLRVDVGVEAGGAITTFYDPMIGKLIAHAPTREEARKKLAAACDDVEIWPLKTNAGFLGRCLRHAAFAAGGVDANFIARNLEALTASRPSAEALETAAWRAAGGGSPLWGAGFRLNAEPDIAVRLFGDDGTFLAHPAVNPARESLIDGALIVAFERGEAFAFRTRPALGAAGEIVRESDIRSPTPGRVTQLSVKAGQSVKMGQELLVLEAMKMEQSICAPFDGVVQDVRIAVGAQTTEGHVLITLEPLRSASRPR